MVKHFKLPDVGEGLTEADIVKWHVAVGDAVEINQIIIEIETAKAIVELPCPFEGVVAELLVAEGETVDVGTPIIGVTVAGEEPAPPAAPPALAGPVEELPPSPAADPGTHFGPTVGPAAEPPKRTPVLVGYGVKPGATKRRARKDPTTTTHPPRRENAQTLAKPPVRKLAKDLGVDLSTLVGSGPAGSITRDDVRAATTGPARLNGATTTAGSPTEIGEFVPAWAASPPGDSAATVPPVPSASVRAEERVPVRGVRKATAAAMVKSAFTAPHVTEFLQVDVTGSMKAVARLRVMPEFAEVRVGPLLLVARALVLAAGRYPMINSTWADQEIVVKPYVHLGIAVAADRGLIVPNVKDAHSLSLPELARALQELAGTARQGRSTPRDLADGTITITNVGVFGVDAGTPILMPGEAAILAFGQIRDLPWVHKGKIKIRKVTTLSLSFDHRMVDGQLGSAVLKDVAGMLEDPLRMLAY
ncbi:MAG: dihydrolipoamide acetyltransferase family protein [Streptosporangiaceae bacterium]